MPTYQSLLGVFRLVRLPRIFDCAIYFFEPWWSTLQDKTLGTKKLTLGSFGTIELD